MSKKIVKQIRASVGYLSDLKTTSPPEIQKVVDFLFEAAFFDKSDSYFANIIEEDKHNSEEYQFFNGHWYKKTENGHYRGYHGKYIHQAVWEHFNGKIPKGYIIHHIDGDKSNNDISNLQIMTQPEHMKLHRENIESKKCICDYCGKEFVSKPNFKGERRFCSEECGDKWKHEKDYEIRICSECGKEFNVYKYSKTKYCSRECVEKARARNYNKKF